MSISCYDTCCVCTFLCSCGTWYVGVCVNFYYVDTHTQMRVEERGDGFTEMVEDGKDEMNHEKNDHINHDQLTKTSRTLSPVWGRELEGSETEWDWEGGVCHGEEGCGSEEGRKGEVNKPPPLTYFYTSLIRSISPLLLMITSTNLLWNLTLSDNNCKILVA